MPKKRSNRGTTDGRQSKSQKARHCIIHMQNSNMKSFIYLSELENSMERFCNICDIRNRRLQQPITSSQRMQEICDQIPSNFSNIDGYHRDCYQRFTMNLSRLDPSAQSDSGSSELRRSTRTAKHRILSEKECLFCGKAGRKRVRKGKTWTSEGLSRFEFRGGKQILKLAE